ncbi:hypothetical protein E2C01_009386 [Portunus trituberculatus]|uniref:Uncharacterized protein n=1 Tax=Portunus trituberculatus TaxID=210409 RepID=A0A5B7D5I4_PORTR|nr:hypothetical protein [Portunus trituberculatus]
MKKPPKALPERQMEEPMVRRRSKYSETMRIPDVVDNQRVTWSRLEGRALTCEEAHGGEEGGHPGDMHTVALGEADDPEINEAGSQRHHPPVAAVRRRELHHPTPSPGNLPWCARSRQALLVGDWRGQGIVAAYVEGRRLGS